MNKYLIEKLESLGFTPPKRDLLEWALGELPTDWSIMWHDFGDIETELGIEKGGRVYAPVKWIGDAEMETFFESNRQEDNPTTAALKLLITLKEEGVL